jgi:UDP-2-acetamido-2-deoxy-ribo-hexuluronate aminotransferase
MTGMTSLRIPQFKDYVTPVYLRYPVLVRDSGLRDRIIKKLNDEGIGATASYPRPINEISEIQNIIVNKGCSFPGGKRVATEIVTLPTHPYVTEGDLAKTVIEISRCIKQASIA